MKSVSFKLPQSYKLSKPRHVFLASQKHNPIGMKRILDLVRKHEEYKAILMTMMNRFHANQEHGKDVGLGIKSMVMLNPPELPTFDCYTHPESVVKSSNKLKLAIDVLEKDLETQRKHLRILSYSSLGTLYALQDKVKVYGKSRNLIT